MAECGRDTGANIFEESTRSRQGRKKKLDEYMDELYGLEFNDMVSFTLKQALDVHKVVVGWKYANTIQVH